MLRLSNIAVRDNISDNTLISLACKKYKLDIKNVISWHIYKKSIDARDKEDIHYVYTIDVNYKNENSIKHIEHVTEYAFPKIDVLRTNKYRPVIVGAGPSGLFAALILAQNGMKPIVIEQGSPVEIRKNDVNIFLQTGKLNINSNVQFGEGGAGTFSDGKLTTGINNKFCKKVLEEFHNFGAPEQILYTNKPHIGTDNLINVIQNMRKGIIDLGGDFLFNEKVTDIEIKNNKVTGIICSHKIETDTVILAIGHSARDTFEKLLSLGIRMEPKNFSVGVRIEHKQEMINNSQYSKNTKLKLPPAEYKLACHLPSGRSCYTFCMCPGGRVIASSSEYNTIVTNGMSEFLRNGENANSALLVNITPDDFSNSSVLNGMYFQKELEESAFTLGGSNYNAPIQRLEDFMNNVKSTKIGYIKPTYLPGVTLANLNDILPDYVSETLKEGIKYFGTKIHGFDDGNAILTGVETRSSSPVRIIRNKENMMCNISGIYPCGEGAGYAGGIMSASVDGIKIAIKILTTE